MIVVQFEDNTLFKPSFLHSSINYDDDVINIEYCNKLAVWLYRRYWFCYSYFHFYYQQQGLNSWAKERRLFVNVAFFDHFEGNYLLESHLAGEKVGSCREVLLVHLTDSGKFLAAGPMRGSPGPPITLAPAWRSLPPASLSCCYWPAPAGVGCPGSWRCRPQARSCQISRSGDQCHIPLEKNKIRHELWKKFNVFSNSHLGRSSLWSHPCWLAWRSAGSGPRASSRAPWRRRCWTPPPRTACSSSRAH